VASQDCFGVNTSPRGVGVKEEELALPRKKKYRQREFEGNSSPPPLESVSGK